jgi:hypothetical protein
MSLSKREKIYIRARLDGASDAEAGELAGYTGRAPARVRKHAARALLLRAEPDLAASYEQRRAAAQAKIDAIRTKQLHPLYAELGKMAAMAMIAEMVLEAQGGQQKFVPPSKSAQ